MNALIDWLVLLGSHSLPWFWLPLASWTILALLSFVCIHWLFKLPALARYHAHVALLLALPASLILAPLVAPLVATSSLLPDVVTYDESLPVLETEGLTPPHSFAPISSPNTSVPSTPYNGRLLFGILIVLAGGICLIMLARLWTHIRAFRAFKRSLALVQDPLLEEYLSLLASDRGISRTVTLMKMPDEKSPLTFGWLRPVIVIPKSLLSDRGALRLALNHELIHIRRHDYALSWICRLFCYAFAFHPLVWILRRAMDQEREISCDEEVLQVDLVPPKQYASLLLRFSSLSDLVGPTALCMIAPNSNLKKRLHAMKNTFATSGKPFHRFVFIPVVLLILPVFLAACITKTNSETIRMNPEEVSASSSSILEHDDVRTTQDPAVVAREVLARRAEEHQAALRRAQERQEALMREQAQVLRDQEAQLTELHREMESQQSRKSQMVRLEMQVAYLQEEIEKATREIKAYQAAGVSEEIRTRIELTSQRVELLKHMYMQRLEEVETLKMDFFIREAMAE